MVDAVLGWPLARIIRNILSAPLKPQDRLKRAFKRVCTWLAAFRKRNHAAISVAHDAATSHALHVGSWESANTHVFWHGLGSRCRAPSELTVFLFFFPI